MSDELPETVAVATRQATHYHDYQIKDGEIVVSCTAYYRGSKQWRTEPRKNLEGFREPCEHPECFGE